jgi:hypothetical protein
MLFLLRAVWALRCSLSQTATYAQISLCEATFRELERHPKIVA